MEALLAALGRPVCFSVVAPDSMVRRAGGRDVPVLDEPAWAEPLRVLSGMRQRGFHV